MADAEGKPVDLVAFQHDRLDGGHFLGSPHFRNMAITEGPSVEIIFVVLIISDLEKTIAGNLLKKIPNWGQR